MQGIGTYIVFEGEGCYFRDRVRTPSSQWARGILVRERRLKLGGDRRSDQGTNRENTISSIVTIRGRSAWPGFSSTQRPVAPSGQSLKIGSEVNESS